VPPRDSEGLLALSVDVEEWYAGITDLPSDVGTWPSRMDLGLPRLLDLLESTDTSATFFVLGHVAREHPELIRRIAEAGHEMGVHDDYHLPLWGRCEHDFRESVKKALDSVEQASGTDAKRFRAPCFSVDGRTLWALDVLEDMGFEFDSSVFPVHNPRYGFPQAPRFPYRTGRGGRLVEFPISTVRIGPVNIPFSGGFYLRALPLTVITACLKSLLSRGFPGICYVHPWELDRDQPSLPGGVLYRMRHGFEFGDTSRKLEALLRCMRFTTAGRVLAKVGV